MRSIMRLVTGLARRASMASSPRASLRNRGMSRMITTYLAKNAIDRFPGEPEMITDLLLRKAQVECRPRDQSASAQSVVEVNQHRGNSFRGFEAGDASRKRFGTPSGLNKKRGEAYGNLAVFHQPIK